MQPQIPRQGFIQPGPGQQGMGLGFGGRPPMMGSGFGGRNPMMGMNQGPRTPMMGGMNRMARAPFMGMGSQAQVNRGGGLFSRLLGMGNQTGRMGGLMGGMQQAGRAAGGAGGGGIMNFLNNTQQVLRTAQSIGPMVQQFQQYGHLVKNLPAMWKLYRGLKNSSDNTETDSESSSKNKKSSSSSKSKQTQTNQQKKKQTSESSSSKTANPQKSDQVTWKKQTSTSYGKGSSSPKLYI
jgi:hypothetical protein